MYHNDALLYYYYIRLYEIENLTCLIGREKNDQFFSILPVVIVVPEK